MNEPEDPATSKGVSPQGDAGCPSLRHLIRADQLAAVRRSVLISIPVNVILGIANLLMALRYGPAEIGVAWFAASSVANGLRVALCRARFDHPRDRATPREQQAASARVEWLLRLSWILALVSGLVWAAVPLLCAGYTSPQTQFFLIVVCGITAGAVVHGMAYAPVPAAFITPALLSVAGCLFYAGGFDNIFLAFSALLYLAALLRSTRESEGVFRDSSRLKNEATAMALSLRAATELAQQVAEETRQRAIRDTLTGLLNREGFLQELERRAAPSATPLCLMLLDLDGFKAVNDMFGHDIGDALLKQVAARLSALMPEHSAIGRMGGDEFGMLFDPRLLHEEPQALADRLITAIAVPFDACDSIRISVSVGIHPRLDEDVPTMLGAASAALTAAKAAGRKRHCLFDETLRLRLDKIRDVERDLLRALSENTLELWFQPQMGQGGRILSGFEGLIRWQHPRHGWISPPDLIMAATTAGLSEALLRFILKEACAMIRALRDMGLDHLTVAMNVSPREIAQLPLDDLVLGVLAQQSLPPAMLELEITEEAVMDLRAVQGKLSRLSLGGVRLAIDDFGVGYSSLAALRQLQVDRLKIDRCFVTGISGSSGDQVMVQTILGMSQSLGIEVLAEGVETEADMLMLRELGCPLMQGYYLGRPMPGQEALSWMRRPEREGIPS